MVSRNPDHAASNRSHSPSDGRGSPPVIFPRRKAGQNKRPATHHPVVVTYEILSQQFDVPLWKACRALGICATAMKKVCRKLGVMKWPYKENHMPGKKCSSSHKATSSSASVSSVDSATEDMPSSPVSPPVAMGSVRRAPAVARPVATRAAPVRGSTRAASAAAAARVAALCAREREGIESGSEVSTPSTMRTVEGDEEAQEDDDYESEAATRVGYAFEGRPGYEGPEEEDEVSAQQASRGVAAPVPQVVLAPTRGDVDMGGYGQQQPQAYAGGFYAPALPVDYASQAKVATEGQQEFGGRIATGFDDSDDSYYSSDGWLEEPDPMVGECCEDLCYPAPAAQSEEAAGASLVAFNNYMMCF